MMATNITDKLQETIRSGNSERIIWAAANLYLARRDRRAHPAGSSDPYRWYPSDDESQDCCGCIREPSRAYPWSLMTHCRTVKHIAHLAGIPNAAREIRRAAKMLDDGDLPSWEYLVMEQ